ncbi:hypothetical protein ACXR0O_19170 [Verrucomicrobiota bacterium sgz303538]
MNPTPEKFLQMGGVVYSDPRPSYQPHDRIPRGASIPFGATEAKELRTDLPGRVRIKLRNCEFPRAFVRHDGTTRHFMILDFGTHWELGQEHGQNVHYRATP